jgi:HD-like signal output (HDOD) protein
MPPALTIDELIDATPNLPSAGPAALEVMRMCGADASGRQISEAVGRDPGLAGRVLRLANSAWYGGSPLASLSQAVLRLGPPAVRRLAAAAAAQPWLSRPLPALGLPAGALMTASVASGVGAARAADGRLDEELAFTSGLMSDVGLAVLSFWAEGKLEPIFKIGAREGLTLPQAELKALGFTHAELGARLLERWGLPAELWKPIQAQDLPGGRDEAQINDALRVGRLAAAASGMAIRPPGLREENHLAPLERLGIGLSRLREIADDISRQMAAYSGAAA